MAKPTLKTNPFMLFWLGILTGALIVGLVFLYKLYSPADVGDTSVLRYSVPNLRTTSAVQTINPINPVGFDDPGNWLPTGGTW